MLKVECVLRDENGNNVLNDFFDSIIVREKYILVKRGLNYGLYNTTTLQKILDCEWNSIKGENSYIIAQKDGFSYLFTNEGKKVLKSGYDIIKIFKKGILVSKNRKKGFIRFDGKVILYCDWKNIEPYTQALIAYKGNGERKKGCDYKGEEQN